MRVVFVTQVVDPDDPVLGATVAKIRALAARCDHVTVLAAGGVPGALPANCTLRPFAAATRLGRGLRFARALAAELPRSRRPAAVIAHMCPIYAVLAAPLCRPLGIRVVLWFTQARGGQLLRLAARLSDTLATAHASSVPTAARRVAVIGHGIDLDAFPCAPPAPAGRLELLALGRTSTAKGLPAIAEAVGLLRDQGVEARLRVVGRSRTEAELAGLRELQAAVAARGLEGSVVVEGELPRSQVAALLASSHALVSNTRGGALDKVVLEAAAACVPVLVSGAATRPLVEGLEPDLAFAPDDAAGLARAAAALAAAPADARAALGRALRDRVAASHSVDAWAEGMLRVCA